MSQPCWIPVLTHGQFFFSGQLYNGWRQSKLSLAVHSNMCIWLNYQTRKDNIKTNTSSKNLTVKISPYKKSRKLLKIPYELWALLNSESGRWKIKPNNQSGKGKISQEANDNSKEKQANRLKRGKTRVTKSRLVLGLNPICWQDGASFLDQSQCEVKETQVTPDYLRHSVENSSGKYFSLIDCSQEDSEEKGGWYTDLY